MYVIASRPAGSRSSFVPARSWIASAHPPSGPSVDEKVIPYTLREGHRVVALATRHSQQALHVPHTSTNAAVSPSQHATPRMSLIPPPIFASTPTETWP